MEKYLITPSLLNSFSCYLKDEFKSPADSRADFLKTLSREGFEPNQAMVNDIWNLCNDGFNSPENEEEMVVQYQIASIVKGGLWQTKCQKELTIGNQTFLLYGEPNVVKADTVYDIKFTSNYKLGKFQDSIQHLIYLYCLDMPKFAYLISDGKEWWREDYFNNIGVEGKIKGKISEFLNYLENDSEAKELFNNKWKTN
jgi:hypothetical protein